MELYPIPSSQKRNQLTILFYQNKWILHLNALKNKYRVIWNKFGFFYAKKENKELYGFFIELYRFSRIILSF